VPITVKLIIPPPCSALTAHPAVLEAAVVGIPDERLGERVVAVLVPSSSPFSSLLVDRSPPLSRAAGEAVLAACRPRLAGYKLPRALLWWPAEWLPRTASG